MSLMAVLVLTMVMQMNSRDEVDQSSRNRRLLVVVVLVLVLVPLSWTNSRRRPAHRSCEVVDSRSLLPSLSVLVALLMWSGRRRSCRRDCLRRRWSSPPRERSSLPLQLLLAQMLRTRAHRRRARCRSTRRHCWPVCRCPTAADTGRRSVPSCNTACCCTLPHLLTTLPLTTTATEVLALTTMSMQLMLPLLCCIDTHHITVTRTRSMR